MPHRSATGVPERGCQPSTPLSRMSGGWAVYLGLLLVSSAAAARQSVSPNTFSGFIQVRDQKFVDQKCLEFPVTGFNGWELMESAASIANFSDVNGMDAVDYTFSEAAANGMTVVRLFGHGINSTLALQPAPGVYNETAFRGLDMVIDSAAQYGVRLIVTLADSWNLVDSIHSYSAWANLSDWSDFFWDPTTTALFRNHIHTMTHRVNSVNGIMYKDDPTIMAWDLMNEPRCNCFPSYITPGHIELLPHGCQPQCSDNVTTWVSEMSTYLKQQDSNHLVTVGEEGFWGYHAQAQSSNPGNGWASLTGDNFTAQHQPATIDFAAFHYWPDLWTPNVTDFTFLDSWMQAHASAAAALGKPLILEEFGKNATTGKGYASLEQSIEQLRAPTFQQVYSTLNSSLASNGSLRGVLFWQWGMGAHNDDTNNIEVANGDFDFETIVIPTAQAALQQTLSGGSQAFCKAPPATISAPSAATATAG